MNKQDWYLNKLNITQYLLRKPNVIKGEAKIHITDNIRLIVITESQPAHEKIFQDILRAIHVSPEDCLTLTPSQLLMPLEQINHVIWFIDETLPESWQSSSVRDSKPIITTQSLAQIALSPQLKRQLWQTLCQYENYFNTH